MIKQVYWISDEEWKRIEPLLPRGAAVRIPLRPSLSVRYTHTPTPVARRCRMHHARSLACNRHCF